MHGSVPAGLAPRTGTQARLIDRLGRNPLPCQFQMDIDAFDNLFGQIRLDDVVHPPVAQSLQPVGKIGFGRKEQDGNMRCRLIRLQKPRQGEAVHLRHAYIKKNQIWQARQGASISLRSVKGNGDAISAMPQHFKQHPELIEIIVYHQYMSTELSASIHKQQTL